MLEIDSEVDLSVVIVSYNTKDMTVKCLQSVVDNTLDISVQIIVVDNKSSDGSLNEIRKRFPEILTIDSPENGGFASGNNQALNYVTGEFVLLLNPDSLLFDTTIGSTLNFLKSNSNIGVVGCKVVNEDGQIDPTIFRFLNLSHVFINCFIPSSWSDKTKYLGDYRYASMSLDETQDVDVVAGCFMLLKSSTIRSVGGLDDRFFMYGEEAEWCFRLKAAGFRVVYFPQAKVLHYGGASSFGKTSWQLVEMAKGQLTFLLLTQGFMVYYLSNILMLFRDCLQILLFGAATCFRFDLFETKIKPMGARLTFHFKNIFIPLL